MSSYNDFQLRFNLFHDFLDTPLSQLERQLETLVKWLEHITVGSIHPYLNVSDEFTP